MSDSSNVSMSRKLRRFRKNLKIKFNNQVDIPLGRAIFKNTAGLRFNLQGSISNYKIKKSVKDPRALELFTKGLLNLGRPYDQNLINSIRKKFEQQIEDKNFSIIRSHYGGKVYGRMLFNPIKNIPEMKELLNEDLIKLLGEYYQNFKIVHVYGFRNHHIPPEIIKETEMLSSGWHCDKINTSRIKLMVYLTDVTEKDGPFFVHTKERTRELIEMGFENREKVNLSDDNMNDPKYLKKFVGPSGTAGMANTGLCLHRATIPEKGRYRDVLHFQFEPSDNPLPRDWENYVVDDETRYSLEKNNQL